MSSKKLKIYPEKKCKKIFNWSSRGLNSRHLTCEASALPLSYSPIIPYRDKCTFLTTNDQNILNKGRYIVSYARSVRSTCTLDAARMNNARKTQSYSITLILFKQIILKESFENYKKFSFNSFSTFRTSVLFVSISFIVLMIISLIWLVFYYVQRFRYLQTKDKQSVGHKSAF